MKPNRLFIAAVLIVALPMRAADVVSTTALPAAVKRTLDATARGEPVKEIRVREEDGRTVYDIELERRKAPNPRLRIAADGTLLRDAAPAPVEPGVVVPTLSEYDASPIIPGVKFEELPEKVQQTIRREAGGREVGAIRPDTVEGRSGYMVEFRERGRNPRFYVAEDGSVLRPEEKPPVLMLGTMLSDAPTVVRQAIQREVGKGDILKVDKEGRIGEPKVYRVDVRGSEGTYHLRIAENGRILSDSRAGAADRPGK